MPAPSRGEFGFERAGQQWTEDREPAFVEEVWAKLNGGEVFEEFACLLARIDSRERVAGAVSVAAEKFGRAEVLRIGVKLLRVFAQ